MRPWLLLDVDGPLNPFRMPANQAKVRGYALHHLTVDGTMYPVLLNRDHGEALMALTDVVDLAWATTWEHDANRLLSPLLGLPMDLPVIEWPPNARSSRRGSWKTPYVAQWVGRRPFAWVDDEVNRHDRAWLFHRRPVDSYLLRRIEPNVGLVNQDFAVIRRWALGVLTGF